MSRRGSQFTRVLNYFREVDTLEAEACITAATRILAERKRAPQPRPRKTKATAAKPNAAISTEATANAG
jgi:hypothetical protein